MTRLEMKARSTIRFAITPAGMFVKDKEPKPEVDRAAEAAAAPSPYAVGAPWDSGVVVLQQTQAVGTPWELPHVNHPVSLYERVGLAALPHIPCVPVDVNAAFARVPAAVVANILLCIASPAGGHRSVAVHHLALVMGYANADDLRRDLMHTQEVLVEQLDIVWVPTNSGKPVDRVVDQATALALVSMPGAGSSRPRVTARNMQRFVMAFRRAWYTLPREDMCSQFASLDALAVGEWAPLSCSACSGTWDGLKQCMCLRL